MSIQKTRHQKLNSDWVMNSLGDKPDNTLERSDPVIKLDNVSRHLHMASVKVYRLAFELSTVRTQTSISNHFSRAYDISYN